MIAELIYSESSIMLSSLFWGMILAWEYDCIRVFRRIVRHKKVWVMSVEDIIFWINAAVRVFQVTYEINDGIVRGFSIAGFVAGAVIYHYAFGNFYVKYVSKWINFILKPLKKCQQLIKIVTYKLKGRRSNEV
jgi:spore cortex biosynthesis protein YabQ